MSAELLSSLSGVFLSLSFSYVPGVKDSFDELSATGKRLVMLLLLLAMSLSAFGLSCAQWINYVTCDQRGAQTAITAFIAALVANQATFLVSPKPE